LKFNDESEWYSARTIILAIMTKVKKLSIIRPGATLILK
jgi:hypothetical protein